ncbi:kinase-like domain-containing protein [Mycena sp. CBHHK59/15]|nr:kinase-like domain-containing protein [Mycena sp. CBHHK59/15]
MSSVVILRLRLGVVNAFLHPRTVEAIVLCVYSSCLGELKVSDCPQHFCSPAKPCRKALEIIYPLLSLRLVAPVWNEAIQCLRGSLQEAFFCRVEDGYYPHRWHINTRIRKSVLLGHYRIFRTITSEAGSRGVYLAYDFGSSDGCSKATEVIVKAWVSTSDFECQRETAAYRVFASSPCPGVPIPLESAHDPLCDVYALVLPKLGPTLEDLRERLPDHKFDERMVLMVAIQMIDRYRDIHARCIIHSGIKPGNICLAPYRSGDLPSMLYAIDFGFSSSLDATEVYPLPSPRRIDAVGQSQRDDLESLAYLLSYLYHSQLPWDTPSFQSNTSYPSRARSLSPSTAVAELHQPHVWHVKTATPSAILFRDMDQCFQEFWKDVKALAYAEVPDYDTMKRRFERCLEEHKKLEENTISGGWWSTWDVIKRDYE